MNPSASPSVVASSIQVSGTTETVTDDADVIPKRGNGHVDNRSLSPRFHPQQSSAHSSPDCLVYDADGIRVTGKLAVQGLTLAGDSAKVNNTRDQVKMQCFTAGRQHARKRFTSACIETQLAAKMTEGPEAPILVQRAQGLFDALHALDNAIRMNKDSLPTRHLMSETISNSSSCDHTRLALNTSATISPPPASICSLQLDVFKEPRLSI